METVDTIDAQPKQERKTRFKNPLNPPIAYVAARYGGEKAKEWERFLRFSVVGALGAVIDLGILMGSQATFLPPENSTNVAIATTLAFLSAVISNFIWTTIWVYPDSRTHSRRKQLMQFTVLSIIGWVFRTLWVKETYDSMGRIVTPVLLPVIHVVKPDYLVGVDQGTRLLAEGRLGSVATQMIAMVVVMFWNFFANRYWTYNDVD